MDAGKLALDQKMAMFAMVGKCGFDGAGSSMGPRVREGDGGISLRGVGWRLKTFRVATY